MTTFADFADTIAGLSDRTLATSYPLPEALRLPGEGKISRFYAPFDHVNTAARVIIVGITPGGQQAINAIRAARDALRRGESRDEACRAAKRTGSFSGPMRRNLVAMLDHFGFADWLGVATTEALFESGSEYAHFTSALRHPVFVNGDNYTGLSPKLLRSAYLRANLVDELTPQLAAIPEAIIVPLGDTVREALDHLADKGLVDSGRIMPGLVHPSGANAERIKYLMGRKRRADLSSKVNADKLDEARLALQTFSKERLGVRI